MCIVSEPNKYDDVKSYFPAPVHVLASSGSGTGALMKLFAFCTLEVPKFENLDTVPALPVSFEDAQRMP